MISILIVEDEAPIRELLRISLKEAGEFICKIICHKDNFMENG